LTDGMWDWEEEAMPEMWERADSREDGWMKPRGGELLLPAFEGKTNLERDDSEVVDDDCDDAHGDSLRN